MQRADGCPVVKYLEESGSEAMCGLDTSQVLINPRGLRVMD